MNEFNEWIKDINENVKDYIKENKRCFAYCINNGIIIGAISGCDYNKDICFQTKYWEAAYKVLNRGIYKDKVIRARISNETIAGVFDIKAKHEDGFGIIENNSAGIIREIDYAKKLSTPFKPKKFEDSDKENEEKFYTCVERKILPYLNPCKESKLYVAWIPCIKCVPFLCNVDTIYIDKDSGSLRRMAVFKKSSECFEVHLTKVEH